MSFRRYLTPDCPVVCNVYTYKGCIPGERIIPPYSAYTANDGRGWNIYGRVASNPDVRIAQAVEAVGHPNNRPRLVFRTKRDALAFIRDQMHAPAQQQAPQSLDTVTSCAQAGAVLADLDGRNYGWLA